MAVPKQLVGYGFLFMHFAILIFANFVLSSVCIIFAFKFDFIMLKFISFGSGSSGNSYLLLADDDALVIDSGVGVRSLKKYYHDFGIKLSDIHSIIITHDHADHVKSVGAMSNEWDIPVYATEAVHEGIRRNYCVRKKIGASNVRYIKKDDTYQIGSFKVTPFDVPHDSNDNVGYRIERNGVVFCLMTDVGHVTDKIKENVSLADYLVIEANHDEAMLAGGPYPQHLKVRVAGDRGHMSNRVCAETIAACASDRLKHVWLCHLSEENNHPVLLAKTMENVLGNCGEKVGRNFKLDILKRKTPTGFFTLE